MSQLANGNGASIGQRHEQGMRRSFPLTMLSPDMARTDVTFLGDLQINSTAHFANDLGLDSLDTVEVVMAIEEVRSNLQVIYAPMEKLYNGTGRRTKRWVANIGLLANRSSALRSRTRMPTRFTLVCSPLPLISCEAGLIIIPTEGHASKRKATHSKHLSAVQQIDTC